MHGLNWFKAKRIHSLKSDIVSKSKFNKNVLETQYLKFWYNFSENKDYHNKMASYLLQSFTMSF